VTTHGWQQATDISAVEFGKSLAGRGVRHCLYTDIARDGALTGVNHEATVALAHSTGLQVIASGGVSTLDDIRILVDDGVVAGVVVGKALYEQRFRLREALEIVGASDAG
jgi:phosphoribosylformimino-5-aminoimidazole carboxamide ribotide isomerase